MNICQAIFCILPGIVLWTMGTAAAQQREPRFPYNALVISETARIHSGPGAVHYPTEQLRRNDTVDVYRHDPGGWCAIRPPSTSFSLIPASVVEIQSGKIGQIREDAVEAWVGTRFGSVEKPLRQVRLKKGERVEITSSAISPKTASAR